MCAQQFLLCRDCDRGQIYCSTECRCEARRRSRREGSKRYQDTERGKALHAMRQKRYRSKKPSVTHQGSHTMAADDLLITTTESGSKEEVRTSRNRCTSCSAECGPYFRLDFWRGGRCYSKLKRRIKNDEKGNGGRSPPAVSRRRLAPKHYRKAA